MLSREEIQSALQATRVVPLTTANPHGPFGLAQLAEAVRRLQAVPDSRQVQRPVALPAAAWEKLDDIARELGRRSSTQLTASDVVTSLVMQSLDAVEKSP